MPIGYDLKMTGSVLIPSLLLSSCAAGNVVYTSTNDHLGYWLTSDADKIVVIAAK